LNCHRSLFLGGLYIKQVTIKFKQVWGLKFKQLLVGLERMKSASLLPFYQQKTNILLHFGNMMCFVRLQDPVDPQEACRGPRGHTTLYQIRFQIGSFTETEIVNSSACGAERCSHTFNLLNVLSDSVPSSYDSVSVAAENVVGVGPARTCTTQTISELNSTMLVHRGTNTHTCVVSMCTF